LERSLKDMIKTFRVFDKTLAKLGIMVDINVSNSGFCITNGSKTRTIYFGVGKVDYGGVAVFYEFFFYWVLIMFGKVPRRSL